MKNVLKAIALVGAGTVLIFGIGVAVLHTAVELEENNEHFFFE